MLIYRLIDELIAALHERKAFESEKHVDAQRLTSIMSRCADIRQKKDEEFQRLSICDHEAAIAAEHYFIQQLGTVFAR
jgi:hypothetical protein